jgi:hypothetical protein
MKHLLLFLLILFSVQIFAAYQYNTKGNQTWLTFDSSTDLYLEASRSGKTNDHENFIDRGEGIVDWGWYNLNTEESGSFKESGSHTFTENDKIAVWVKDEQGNVYNSTKEPSEYIWGKSDTKDGILKVYGGNKGSNGSHEYYVFSVKTVPTHGNSTPSGQPLPGILGTLLVGGTGIWYLKNRKRLVHGQ